MDHLAEDVDHSSGVKILFDYVVSRSNPLGLEMREVVPDELIAHVWASCNDSETLRSNRIKNLLANAGNESPYRDNSSYLIDVGGVDPALRHRISDHVQ